MKNLDFWCFENNVLYSKKTYSLEEAQRLFNTLQDCSNCVDCSNCRYCVDCFECDSCSNCIGCMGCYDCRDCRRCLNCHNCSADDDKKFCIAVTF